MKIQAPGAVLEPSGEPLGGLGVCGDFWRRWSQDGRKMGQVGSNLRPRWAMMAQDSHLGAFWVVLGPLVVTFFAIFAKMAEV